MLVPPAELLRVSRTPPWPEETAGAARKRAGEGESGGGEVFIMSIGEKGE